MTLDKAIKHNKEYRKEYKGVKAINKTCRNHGGDAWCIHDRTNKYTKRKQEWQDKLEEYLND